MRRHVAVAFALSISIPIVSGSAQDSTRASCPVSNGLTATFSTGAPRDSLSVLPGGGPRVPVLRLDAQSVIDTVWRFDIAERSWTRPYFEASVGAGWAGDARGFGMTTARDSSAAKGWSACVGASVGMRNPTLMLRGARGEVHLRADVRSLSRIGRGPVKDTTVQPRR
jgi:hypothetical protein